MEKISYTQYNIYKYTINIVWLCKFGDCNQVFLSKKELYFHQKINGHYKVNKNGIISTVYICDCMDCNKSFTKLKPFNQHLLEHNKRKFKCDYKDCNKEYSKKCDLIIHKQKHKLNNAKQHICEYCQKNFASKSSLKKHMILHDKNLKQYSCKLCLKSFKRKESLDIHSQTHLPRIKRKLFYCEYCNKSFTYESNLKKHFKKFHP